MNESNFICKQFDGLWFLGTNKTSSANAVVDQSLVGSKLIIPQTIQGHEIDAIGSYAFYEILAIEEVIIACTPKVIYSYAFAHLPNLKYIVIPPSVEEICRAAITAYNITKPNTSQIHEFTSQGIMKVVFLPQSNLTMLHPNSLSRKERIEVYFWENKMPSYNGDPFYTLVGKIIKIYAPYIPYFCGKRTIQSQTMQVNLYRLKLSTYIFISILN